jgi:carboxypeptidase Q
MVSTVFIGTCYRQLFTNRRHRMRKPALLGVILAGSLLALGSAAPAASERIDYETNAKIRKEGREQSQIMRTLHYLTDLYGPRLTGSPNHKAAAEWALRQMTEWGLENARLEPWDFGRPGWLNERFAGFILSPVKDSLVGEVLAWTPSTRGTVVAGALRIEPPQCETPRATGGPMADLLPGPPLVSAEPPKCPTPQELRQYLSGVRDQVQGRIVLVGAPAMVPVSLTGPSPRMGEETLRRRFDLDNPPPPYTPPQVRPAPGQLSANEITRQVDQFLVENGALVRLNDAGREHGQIRAFQNRTYDPSKAVPTVVLRNEDYGRISRLLDSGHRGGAGVHDRQPRLPGGRDLVQRDRRDPRDGQEGRSRHAGRPPGFLARGDRRHRQRDRRGDDDGGGAHPDRHRRGAAPHDPRRALGR